MQYYLFQCNISSIIEVLSDFIQIICIVEIRKQKLMLIIIRKLLECIQEALVYISVPHLEAFFARVSCSSGVWPLAN